MNKYDDQTGKNSPARAENSPREGRTVYLLQDELVVERADTGIGFQQLFSILWRRKWTLILITVTFAFLSVLYGLSQPRWYRAEIVVAPADSPTSSSFANQFSPLAALAGVNISDGRATEAIAVLESREFVRSFIARNNLLPVLFSQRWDDVEQIWLIEGQSEVPDSRDGVKFFREKIMEVHEDRAAGLFSIFIEWRNPEEAANWANAIVHRLNEQLRQKALKEARDNVAYLRSELAKTNPVTLQQSIGRLLEHELNKIMVARGNQEYAFRVIDPAEVPKVPSRPKRTLIAFLGTFLGFLIALILAVILDAIQRYRNSDVELE